MGVCSIRTMEEFERREYNRKNWFSKENMPKVLPKNVWRKKKAIEKIKNNNQSKKECAKKFANEMKKNPSPLEQKMQEFLDVHNISYQFQKIFYIKDNLKKIKKFFIADFFIPSKNIIIETDGGCHNGREEYDKGRSRLIEKHYPGINIIRWRFKDFHSVVKMKQLLKDVA